MACRKNGINYVGVGLFGIAAIIDGVRSMEWHKKWRARKAERQSRVKKSAPAPAPCDYWVIGRQGDARFAITAIPFPKKIAKRIVEHTRKYLFGQKIKAEISKIQA